MSPRILMVGLGSIGQRHLHNLKTLGVNDLLAWRVRNRPLSDVSLLDDVSCYDHLEDAFIQSPDAVMVCGPTRYHLDVALKAAQAGCHLFIEKPLAHSWDGVDELIQIVKNKNLITLVGFNLRFHPALQWIKTAIQSEKIGKVVGIQAQVGQYLPDWHPLEDYREGYSARRELGGGVIFDLIHELDYVQWLGGDVASIACFAGKVSHLEINTEDCADILMRFACGGTGNVHVDYVQRIASRTCRIVGEEGTIFWDAVANEVHTFRVAEKKWQIKRWPDLDRNQTFLSEMEHFLGCLSGREKPLIDVEEGARILKIALAAHESSDSGKVVAL